MSKFLSDRLKDLEPYTPGEQPQILNLIKLNTNESPFPPSKKAVEYAAEEAELLQLYPDPECKKLTQAIAEMLGVNEAEILVTNGSDEILNFAFMAYCDAKIGAAFPDITYGFYKVFARLYGVPYTEIPLKCDLSINIDDYKGVNKTVFIANPNAPTGICLSPEEIEEIIKSNLDRIVVVDEAYIDFGGESCVPLIRKYDNLLVTRTFSKSRSMAGARLGFGVGSKELIRDLNAIKYSTNPYNINRMTMAAGLGVLSDEEYTKANCTEVCKTRQFTTEGLRSLGFEVAESKTNFVFAKHPKLSGKKLYDGLRQRRILVRHFSQERISEYNRITIGTKEQMQEFLKCTERLLKEEIL